MFNDFASSLNNQEQHISMAAPKQTMSMESNCAKYLE